MAYNTMAVPSTFSCKKFDGAALALLTANNNKSPAAGNLKPTAAARVFPTVFPSSTTSCVRAIISSTKKWCVCKSTANNVGGLLLNDNDLPDPLNEEDASNLLYSPGHKPHNAFPRGFVFGAASAAFQVEGATREGGRGESIWDTFCRKHPEKIADGSSGDPGAGSYHYYKEDVKVLVEIGLKAYRFSISWSRVLPNGRGEPNHEGIQYYNNLIDELKDNGIEPYVTLFHWDVPQALEDEYGGFLSRRIVEDYKNYVDLCFNKFGDRVKHWITMNEPYVFSTLGYSKGIHAPGHCTPGLKVGDEEFVCPVGDSIREPYKVAHNILLAHSEAAQLYKDNYKAKFGGKVGITLISLWFEPYNNQPYNIEAQGRALDFMLGWFMDPLKFGNYPFSMRALVRERLPSFTPEESAKLKNSFDFIGLNYYTARYARDKSNSTTFTDKINICEDDKLVGVLVAKDNVPIGPAQPRSWVNVYPQGIKKLLLHIKNRYSNPPVYITENGVLKYNERDKLREEAETKSLCLIDDTYRSEYHASHLQELEDALRSGADVRGYFVWSLLDSFEWRDGYTCQFGLHYRHYTAPDIPNHQRPVVKDYVKQSVSWLRDYLKNISYLEEKQPNTLPPEITTSPGIPQIIKNLP
ncbi:Beta-glucosidase 12 [Platanthera guangdongensis]|uniref:Beta-glucosidase 12 n=1 Tax=Platanthera guangdongensis TaxID=2320717 RepID=A0ABR2MZS9_9ASPA